MKIPAFLRVLSLLAPLPFWSGVAGAQMIGAPVPQAELPPPAPPPVRDGVRLESSSQPARDFRRQTAPDGFIQAYHRQGKPRIAVSWKDHLWQNRGRWTSDTRLVERYDSSRYGSGRSVVEVQRRAAALPIEGEPPFEWEFQDGFLGAFLAAGVTLLDRGLDGEASGFGKTSAQAARAGYVLEILPLSNRHSATGYEVQVRVFDAASGALVTMVNSRALGRWRRDEIELTAQGYRLRDFDQEEFGPLEERFVAGASGYVERRRALRPFRVGEEMAQATMSALMKNWP